MPPSSISQEPIFNLEILSHLRFHPVHSSLDAIFFPSSFLSSLSLPRNSGNINGFPSLCFSQRRSEKPVVSCFLLSTSSKLQTFLIEYSRFVQLDCGRLPVGLGSLGVSLNDGNPLEENGHGVIVEEALPVNGVAVEAPKKVLILMSDTGGGHRASAEAIKAAFNQEFGEEYQVFVTDLWTDHTPWPFNQLPRSYNFLVKHGALWKMTYYGSALV
ncbi:hypothetical protein HPP92_017438 [Vanilla planifolia]|uniref:Diacylglycerol glucosyltransferase N-terminal domain-containing protein n=1 Tax=Vanilla planifolia TaxID=51239 RepID=A0A835UR14_VANPL|nr:hypothetical protein HPP92_017438 [Vanilla planifolia]